MQTILKRKRKTPSRASDRMAMADVLCEPSAAAEAGPAATWSGVNKCLEERDLAAIWEQLMRAVLAEVGEGIYERWFSPLRLKSAGAKSLTVLIPNTIYQVWIESNYASHFQAAIVSVLGDRRAVQFEVAAGAPQASAAPATSEPAEHAAPGEMPVAACEGAAGGEETGGVEPRRAGAGGLNPKYKFETFVVGANSEFAHAAALAVAKAPARTYNPLFIHGGTGLGKTHLLHAIGHAIADGRKNPKVAYVRSEDFTNDFIQALQTNSLPKFRRRYRQVDVLLIDDIQFFAQKERSQEEFFHTFNTLFEGHKQIVLSSDKPASEIPHLEQRLVSRFEWGLTAELQPPDVETRLAILRKKAATLSVRIDPHVLDYLAHRIKSNVRRLEGALLRVAMFASLSHRPLDEAALEDLLRHILQEEARRAVTIDQVQRRVAEHYDVRLADMTSKRRPANIAFPRQVAMFLSRKLTKCSLNEIGEAFGGKDHGTVIHACKTVQARMEQVDSVRQAVRFLETKLQG